MNLQRHEMDNDRELAEGVGFEPTTPFGEHALQACALSRSAIPPRRRSFAPHGATVTDAKTGCNAFAGFPT
jgi:hypothetical protein